MKTLAAVLVLALSACSKPAEPAKEAAPAAPVAAEPVKESAPSQSEKEKALANPYPNDLGPDRLDDAVLASYDPAMLKGYELLRSRCAQCHAPSRPLNSRFDDSDTWNRYVKRMMNKPGCEMTKGEAKAIWQFLAYDSEKRKKGPNAAAWKAHREKLVSSFKIKFPKRYEELKAANDL